MDSPKGNGIDTRAVAVAAVLYRYMNAAGLCWPSVRVVAEGAKTSPNTVQQRIERLEGAGIAKGQPPASIGEQLSSRHPRRTQLCQSC